MKMKALLLLFVLVSVFAIAPAPVWAEEADDEAMEVEATAAPAPDAKAPDAKKEEKKEEKKEKKEKKAKKGAKLEEGQTVDINKADVAEFCRVKGIGKATAEKIVALRESKGGAFKSVDELGEVLKKKLDKMKPFFALSGAKADAKDEKKADPKAEPEKKADPKAEPAAAEDEDEGDDE